MLITARLGLGQVETQSEFLDKTHTKEGVGHQYRGYRAIPAPLSFTLSALSCLPK